MKKFNISLLGLSIFLSTHNIAIAQTVSLAEFSKNEESLNKLYKAFEILQTRNSSDKNSQDYRTSLQYWANIHGYFTDDPKLNPKAKNLEKTRKIMHEACLKSEKDSICTIYDERFNTIPKQTVGTDLLAHQTWGTCVHKSISFLPWHRMYLYFFNQTLKSAIDDENFELPYWKYEDNYHENKLGISLPLEFTDSIKSTYSSYRTLNLNEGGIIPAFIESTQESALPGSIDITAIQALEANTLLDFSNLIENDPHGAIHCGVGSKCLSPYMGIVPSAGNDPIFYLHHRNIDRLWQQWMVNKSNGEPITLKWAKENHKKLGVELTWFDEKMVFVDGDGTEVTVTVADAFDPNYMPKYKDITTKPSIEPKAKLVQSRTKVNILSTKNISVLGQNPQSIDLSTIQKSNNLKGSLISSSKIFLTMEDITLVNNPFNTYSVYLVNNQTGAKIILNTFSFFGINEGSEGTHSHHTGPKLPNVTLDISKELSKIDAKNINQVSISFKAPDLKTESTFKQTNEAGLSIGKIALYLE